jgi:hypothetical protein
LWGVGHVQGQLTEHRSIPYLISKPKTGRQGV